MGYSDSGCYGSEIHTPNLDRLASEGLRFTHFYNTARCCPSRACLMTGLYPHQADVGHMTGNGVDVPGYHNELSHSAVTIAEVLKGAGYETYMLGKWHVTSNDRPDSPKDNWPMQRGFMHYYGTVKGGGNYYDPALLTRDNTNITPENDPEYHPDHFYYTDALADNGVRFIKDHHKRVSDKPMFIYCAFTASHWPLHAPDETIAKYKGVYDQGYDAIRQKRFEREKQLGTIDPRWELSPAPFKWEDQKHKPWEARCMEVYAAQIDRMDQNIGKMVQALRETGELDNTLIMFMQDNGGCAEPVGRVPETDPARMTTTRPMAPDEIQTQVRPVHTRDGRPIRMGPGVMPGPADTFIAYGKAWANVSNTPFREYKHFVHEGGISTELIVHWPARITRPGQLEHQPGHLIDMMATCVDAGGATYPKDITPMQGVSLAPAFTGSDLNRKVPIYFEHEGNRAIRWQNWKLVAKGANGAWELYDIDADRSEMHDLAKDQPQRVAELTQMWTDWAQRSNVLPLVPWEKKKTAEK